MPFWAQLIKKQIKGYEPCNIAPPQSPINTMNTADKLNSGMNLALRFGLASLIDRAATFAPDPTIIERLLHPQRFNKFYAPGALPYVVLFTPFGHSAFRLAQDALQCLHEHSLVGKKEGMSGEKLCPPGENEGVADLVGTAFYPTHHGKKYFIRTANDDNSVPMDVGNGFWYTVIQLLPEVPSPLQNKLSNIASMLGVAQYRPWVHIPKPMPGQLLHHLKLRVVAGYGKKDVGPDTIVVSEHHEALEAIWWSEFLNVHTIFFFTSMHLGGIALYCVITLYPIWVKMVFTVLAVHRESFKAPSTVVADDTDIFEVEDSKFGVTLIEGRKDVVHQFFHSYGRPIRNAEREATLTRLMGIVMAGYWFLVSLVLISGATGYCWLANQVLTAFRWYLAREFGVSNAGRTEQHIANALQSGKKVVLVSTDGTSAVEAMLETKRFATGDEAHVEARKICEIHIATRNLQKAVGSIKERHTKTKIARRPSCNAQVSKVPVDGDANSDSNHSDRSSDTTGSWEDVIEDIDTASE